MPDLKHNFTGGKMNKDLDERLIPNGEYRHAINIQVSTSEESDVGTAQNIIGNFDGCIDKDGNNMWTGSALLGSDFNPIPSGSTTVGSVSDEKNDSLYWLVAGFNFTQQDFDTLLPQGVSLTSPIYAQDMILRKTKNKCEPVFVDQHGVVLPTNQNTNEPYVEIPNTDYLKQVQVGSTVTGIQCDDVNNTTKTSPTVTSIGSLNQITASFNFNWIVTPPSVFTNQTIGYLITEPPYVNYIDPNGVLNTTPPLIDPQQIVNNQIAFPTDQNPGTAPAVGNRINFNIFGVGVCEQGLGSCTSDTFITNVSANTQFCNDLGQCKTYNVLTLSNPIVLDPGNLNDPVFFNRNTLSHHQDHATCGAANNPGLCNYFADLASQPGYNDPGFLNGNQDTGGAFSFNYESTVTTQPQLTNQITFSPNYPYLDEIYDLASTHPDYGSPSGIAFPNTVLEIAVSGYFPNVNPPALDPFSNACLDPNISGPSGIPAVYQNTFSIVYCGVDPVTGANAGDPYVWPSNLSQAGASVMTIVSDFNSTVVYLDQNLDLTDAQGAYCHLYFQSKRVLNYSKDKLITGLNIFDDMLYWVDGVGDSGTEPKKINISRSVRGTDMTGNAHTKLVNDAVGYDMFTGTPTIPIREEHITVIRKSPTQALSMNLLSDRKAGVNYGGIFRTTNDTLLGLSSPNFSSIVSSNKGNIQNFETITEGDEVVLLINQAETPVISSYNQALGPQQNDFTLNGWEAGEVVLIKEFDVNGVQPSYPFNPTIKARIKSWEYNSFESKSLYWGFYENQPPNTPPSNYNPPATPINTAGWGLLPNAQDQWNINNQNWPDAGRSTAHVKLEILEVIGTPPSPDGFDGSTDVLDYVITRQTNPGKKKFEFKLPRFSYRYVYEDGEYSTFAPFTPVAFLPSSFEYHPTDGYNLGMINNVNEITLSNFVTRDIPEDVVAIDLLYKEDISPNIYVVETFKADDNDFDINGNPTLNNWHKNSYTIKRETIKSILPENQILRPFDNVPLKARAQEVTGNRIVYGNYVQNFDLFSGDKLGVTGRPLKYSPNFNMSITPFERQDVSIGTGRKSIKSLREYQLGVTFLDKYGRETPVISNKTGNIALDKSYAAKNNRFVVGFNDGDVPPNLEYFKFYIKETSSEYYNLAMGRWYDAGDNNTWLAFPSSDRNKIDIDTYLVLKKGTDTNNLVKETARYNILAIENEAPDYIKTKKILIDEHLNTGNTIFPATGLNVNKEPIPGQQKFEMNNTNFTTSTGSKLDQIALKDDGQLWIEFSVSDIAGTTKRYRITEITQDDNNNKYYVTVENQLGDELTLIQDGNAISVNAQVRIYKYIVENSNEFDGRFFVKIKEDGAFKENIKTAFDQDETEYSATVSNKVYFISDDISRDHNYFTNDTKTLANRKNFIDNFNNPNYGATAGYHHTTVVPFSGYQNNPSYQKYYDQALVYQIYYGYDHNNNRFTDPTDSELGIFRYLDFFDQSKPGGGTSSQPSIPIQHRQFWSIDEGNFLTTDTVTDNELWPGSMSDNFEYLDANGSNPTSNGPAANSASSNYDRNFGGLTNAYSGRGRINLTFGGIESNEIFEQTSNFRKSYLPTEDFWDVGNVTHPEESDFVDQLFPASKFRWLEDPTETIYTIQPNFGNSLVLRYSEANTHSVPFQNFRQYTMYQHPANFAKNWEFDTLPNLLDGWNPTKINNVGLYGPDIPNGKTLNLTATDATGATSAGTALTGFKVYVTDIFDSVTGHTLEANSTFGLVAKNNGTNIVWTSDGNGSKTQDALVVYKIEKEQNVYAVYLNGYRRVLDDTTDVANVGTPSTGQNLTFVQLQMNGLSPSSATYLSSLHGFNTTYPGVSAVGYTLEFVSVDRPVEVIPENPAIWETEPKDESNLDIYYEASEYIPINLNKNNLNSILPPGTVVENASGGENVQPDTLVQSVSYNGTDDIIVLNKNLCVNGFVSAYCNGITGDFFQTGLYGDKLRFTKPNGRAIDLNIVSIVSPPPNSPLGDFQIIQLQSNLYQHVNHYLDYYNCFSFGNGVESNRVKDYFNLPFITNGVMVSASAPDKYEQEHRKYGLIYSGIYNSKSSINNLNQFIVAEKITKDINPIYGSIQKLHSRDTDLVTLCEDKCLKILSNKDAVFNADGNAQLTATQNVLGQTIPFVGEYGISKNPESFAFKSYRSYFTDKQRGAVIRLSMDGITPISGHGMNDWFKDNLKLGEKLIGSYDDRKGEYNITIHNKTDQLQQNASFNATTVSFKENVKGWVSFKSFIPEQGLSVTNDYYTFLNGNIWKHHTPRRDKPNSDEVTNYGVFYGDFYTSEIDVVINDIPGSVKSFNTLNYEGSQSHVPIFIEQDPGSLTGPTGELFSDNEFYNLNQDFDYNSTPPVAMGMKNGWLVKSITTDLQEGTLKEFINKEGKWFNYIRGREVSYGIDGHITNHYSTYDVESFAIQGIGSVSSISTALSIPTINVTSPITPTIPVTPGGPGGPIPPGGVGPVTPPVVGPTVPGGVAPVTPTGPGAPVIPGTPGGPGTPPGTVVTPVIGPGTPTGPGTPGGPVTPVNPGNPGNPNIILGCTNPNSINYDPQATQDDGSCIAIVLGCTDPLAVNYNPANNFDDGTCQYLGCTNPGATNYDPLANVDDGSCIIAIPGCTDNTMVNYNPGANVDDGSCVPYIYGCTDNITFNVANPPVFTGNAQVDTNSDDGSCIYTGCLNNPSATNYINTYPLSTTTANGVNAGQTPTCDDSLPYIQPLSNIAQPAPLYPPCITQDDGSCTAAPLQGCTDINACQGIYPVGANIDDGSCYYVGCSNISDNITNYGDFQVGTNTSPITNDPANIQTLGIPPLGANNNCGCETCPEPINVSMLNAVQTVNPVTGAIYWSVTIDGQAPTNLFYSFHALQIQFRIAGSGMSWNTIVNNNTCSSPGQSSNTQNPVSVLNSSNYLNNVGCQLNYNPQLSNTNFPITISPTLNTFSFDSTQVNATDAIEMRMRVLCNGNNFNQTTTGVAGIAGNPPTNVSPSDWVTVITDPVGILAIQGCACGGFQSTGTGTVNDCFNDGVPALNYDSTVTVNDPSVCIQRVFGCMDPNATNYDPLANVQQVSFTDLADPCTYPSISASTSQFGCNELLPTNLPIQNYSAINILFNQGCNSLLEGNSIQDCLFASSPNNIGVNPDYQLDGQNNGSNRNTCMAHGFKPVFGPLDSNITSPANIPNWWSETSVGTFTSQPFVGGPGLSLATYTNALGNQVQVDISSHPSFIGDEPSQAISVGYRAVMIHLGEEGLTGGKYFRDGIPNEPYDIQSNLNLNINGLTTGASTWINTLPPNTPNLTVSTMNNQEPRTGMMYIGPNHNKTKTGTAGGPHGYIGANTGTIEIHYNKVGGIPNVASQGSGGSGVASNYTEYPVWPNGDGITFAGVQSQDIGETTSPHIVANSHDVNNGELMIRTLNCGTCDLEARLGPNYQASPANPGLPFRPVDVKNAFAHYTTSFNQTSTGSMVIDSLGNWQRGAFAVLRYEGFEQINNSVGEPLEPGEDYVARIVKKVPAHDTFLEVPLNINPQGGQKYNAGQIRPFSFRTRKPRTISGFSIKQFGPANNYRLRWALNPTSVAYSIPPPYEPTFQSDIPYIIFKIEQLDANFNTDPCSVHTFHITPALNSGYFDFTLASGTESNPPSNNVIIGQGSNMPIYNYGAATPNSVSLDMNNKTVLDNKYGISNGVNTVPQGCTAVPNQISFVSTGIWRISISSIAVTRLDSLKVPVVVEQSTTGNLLTAPNNNGEATTIIQV